MKQQIKKITAIENAIHELNGHNFSCHLCPRNCRVNRHKGEKGFCGVSAVPIVSTHCLHFGEEPCLSGYADYKNNIRTESSLSGSGTVFFAGCNLKCIFCQNYQISWQVNGSPVSLEGLASIFLSLQEKRAMNINLVTPTHVITPVLKALKLSFSHGLHIPIVYNTSAYDSPETISRLDGVIDIYLPDFKYLSKDSAQRFSKASDYPEVAAEAIKEMYRQVGDLSMDKEGNATKGLLVRHMILPGHAAESCAIVEWIAENLSTQTHISLMSQFHPCNALPGEINRGISEPEYSVVLSKAEELGFENVFIQSYPFDSHDHLVPDFSRDNPFSWNED